MKLLDQRTSFLFKKYYNKTASSVEIEELFSLIQEMSDDSLLMLMQEEWENLGASESVFNYQKSLEMINSIRPECDIDIEVVSDRARFPQLNNIGKWSIAAAFLLFTTLGIYFSKSTSPPIVTKTSNLAFDDVLPGGNKAMLTLSSGKKYILDSMPNGVVVKTTHFQINKDEDGQLVYNVFNSKNMDTQFSEMNIISTPIGGEYRVVLPDGSKVWLNAASSIKFPAVFRGQLREVELRGEAFFEVAKIADMPFKVKSRYAEIEVLGTHFNVRAYNDELDMKTTLVEGSVKVRSKSETNILKPGEQAVLQNNRMKLVEGLDVEEQIAWKNGLFQFKDASVEDVMNQAALWYDLKVTYAGKIPRKQITGKTSRKVNVSEFLNLIKYMGVEFKRDGKNVIISK